MPIISSRPLLVGCAFGLITAANTMAQDLPDPLPALPRSMIAETPTPAHVMPASPLIHVPPGGPVSYRALVPLDPAALKRHGPKHTVAKSRSWHWRKLQGKIFGYPEEFEPRPLGSSLYEHGRTMVANGAAARLVLYRYDFVPGTTRLNDRGREQLAKAAAQLAVSPFPLLIERTPDNPALADARRIVILTELGGIPPERVLVGLPTPSGLSGIDAQIIGSNALDRTKDYGPPIPINSNGLNSPSGVTSGQ